MHDEMVECAKECLDELFKKNKIPASHGLGHACSVLGNMNSALKQSENKCKGREISQNRQLCMRLAALLHDSDDKKYFPQKDTKEEKHGLISGYANARKIIKKALKKGVFKVEYSEDKTSYTGGGRAQIEEEIIQMISFVSTSDNGNQIPEAALKHPELLWVRHCDRLEAIGVTGAVRCY